jgi:hypothetical protein
LITLWSGRLTFRDFSISVVLRTESWVLVLGNPEVKKCDVSWSQDVVKDSHFRGLGFGFSEASRTGNRGALHRKPRSREI